MTENHKLDLYQKVQGIRDSLNISDADCPLDVIALIQNNMPDISFDYKHYHTGGMHGMLLPDLDNIDRHMIVLDNQRTRREQNFDCAHELMHYHLHDHRSPHSFSFDDDEKIVPVPVPFYEWQANEGAAELLVPFSQFAPYTKMYRRKFFTLKGLIDFRNLMSQVFNVTPVIIRTRLDSMRYEIFQFLSGTPLCDIELLSATQQESRGINVTSLNEAEDKSFEEAFSWMQDSGPRKYRKVLTERGLRT